MKRIYSLLAALLLVLTVNAQSPDKFNYQAVIRNSDGNIRINQSVNIQIAIIEGSVTGTSMYVETFATTTTSVGMVNLVIGNGSVVSGSVISIDWSKGPFYLKIWVDGGVMGTSQLLSVPYAKYAEKSGNGFSGNYNDLANKPIINNITIAAGTGIKVSGTYPDLTISAIPKHYIGEKFGGGIIFYIDSSEQHGLIAASTDQSLVIPWCVGSNKTTNAVRNGIGAGKINTERIIASHGAGDYAAQICANYNGGNYGDWYLPSKFELNLIYLQWINIEGLTYGRYWSSNEYDSDNAWQVDFSNGNQVYWVKDYTTYIRAIREF